MKEKYQYSSRSIGLKALQISLGTMFLLFAFLERLPLSSISLTSERAVALIPIDNKSSPPTNLPIQATPENMNHGTVAINDELRVMIHPWIPAVSMEHMKPVLREAVMLIFLQTIGIPLIGRFRARLLVGFRYMFPIQRRFRGVFHKVLTSPKLGRFIQRNFRRIWKVLLTGYHKTSASKIVNRCKKYLHAFLHPHHHEHVDDHHDDHCAHGETAKHKGTCKVK
jgi:hypothetical protein